MEDSLKTTGLNSFLVDGFPRSLENWSGWQGIFGTDTDAPTMLFFECPLPVLEERIMGRSKFSGRSDDNVEAVRKRFNTYKNETMPIVDVFRGKGKVVDVDSSKGRMEVWEKVKVALKEGSGVEKPLTERSECLLGLRPWPSKKREEGEHGGAKKQKGEYGEAVKK